MSESTATLDVGIVGLGNMGTGHAETVQDLGHRIVGGVDVVEEKRQSFAAALDTATYENHESLLAEEDPDAFIVTTPNKFHEAPTVAALDRDVSVLCEKPLAHTLDSAERIADAARSSAGTFMVGFQWPLRAAPRVLKAYVDDGEIGEVTRVEANYVRRRGVPGRGGWFTSKDLAGGGALIDIGPHAIDLALHYLDFPDVTEVMGRTRSDFGGRDDYAYLSMWGEDEGAEGFDVDDSATGYLRCADGTTVSLTLAWAANRGSGIEYIVEGTDGGARLRIGEGGLTLYETGLRGTDHYRDVAIDLDDADGIEKDAVFLDAVAGGEKPPINTLQEGLAVQRVIDAIYRSDEEQRSVTL